jgi:hypothetical protein
LCYKLSNIATNSSDSIDDSFSLINNSFNFTSFENFDTHANTTNIAVGSSNLMRNQVKQEKQEYACLESKDEKNHSILENNYQSLYKNPVVNQDKQSIYLINNEPKNGINNTLLCSKHFNDESEEDFVNWDNLL